jgi:5-methylcytosine-specific restriction protein A
MSAARGRTGCAAVRTVQARTKTLGNALSPLRSSAVRVRDAKWYRDVADLKREQPFCVKHLERGQQVVATQTDHIVPVVKGGANDRSNLQRLCDDCHEAKTLTEHGARYVY